jgi:hypothetical protein
VNASLSELTTQGLVARRDRQITILKPDELRRVAHPTS